MTAASLLSILISIYDIPHDPQKVVIEGCRETCVRIVVPKADMENPDLILRLANLIESQVN